jgi:hypothetical protein
MQYAPNVLALDSAAREADTRLKVLIVYENATTTKKAREAGDVVTERLGPGWKINLAMCSKGIP